MRTISFLAAFVALSPLAHAQEEKEKDTAVTIRVLCNQPVPEFDNLKLAQGDKVLHDIKLVPSLFTDPLKVGRGELILAKETGTPEKPILAPILKVLIPAQGKSFVLALFPAAGNRKDAPYQNVLIRTDSNGFKTSDLYLFNLSTLRIGGNLGTKTFELAPGKSDVFTPAPDTSGDRMYQARFYYGQEGKPMIFSDTRWPLAASARVYVFFMPDPERRSVGYVSFREYAPYP